jgi:recombination protein RecR
MHEGLPAPLARLVETLARLPGIGRKSALRLALHLLAGSPVELDRLSAALAGVREAVSACQVCGHLTDIQPCMLCTNPRRDGHALCVIEEPTDLLGIERSGSFSGRYHVLGGVLSPLSGVGPESLNIEALMRRLRAPDSAIREVIIATNPTPEGDATAAYLRDRIAPLGIQVTRIAYGLPQGGDLEYLDGLTIRRALENRRPT